MIELKVNSSGGDPLLCIYLTLHGARAMFKCGLYRRFQVAEKQNNKRVWLETFMHFTSLACVQRKVGGLLARTDVVVCDASGGLSVKLLLSSLLHVCLRCCYYMKSVAK